MRFLKLHLDGFGNLVDRTFVFAPGLNLVFGANEAGKSTLQQALLTMLYGFYDDGSVSRAKQQATQALTPWATGVNFSGWLSYQLDDGQAFRVVRSFSGRPVTRLEIASGGQDIASEFRSASHGRLFFADKQLGMAKQVFENTCVVRQAELVALAESAHAITDTLMRLAASASQDTSTADALAVLDKALRDEIGTDRAWTKPLAQARKRLEELEETQQRTGKARLEAFALVAELNQQQAELDGLDEDIERLNYLALAVERQALQAQLDASRKADEEAKRLAAELERWRPWANFPAHLRDQVISVSTHCTRLAQEIQDQASQAEKARQQRMERSSRIQAVEAQAASLANANGVPVENLSEVQRLNVQWEVATKAERTAEARLHQALERLAESERVLARKRRELGELAELGLEGIDQLQGWWTFANQWVEQSEKEYHRAKTAWQQVGLSDEQFHALAETVQQIESGTHKPERTPKGCRFWSRTKPAQIAPPEVAIYAQVKPIWDQWNTARANVEAAKSNMVSVMQRVQQVFNMTADQRIEQSFFDAANQQLAEYGRLMGETNKQQQTVDILGTQVQHAHSDAESAKDALSEVLRKLGYAVRDLKLAVASFEQDCAHKVQYDQLLAGKLRLQNEERLLAQDEETQLRRKEALRNSLQSLQVLLKQAGIVVRGDDVASAVTEFEEKHRHHQQWLRAREKHQAALDRPASGLTQQERDRARKRLAVLWQQEQEARTAHPEWADVEATHDSHEYEERIRELQAARQTKRERCTQLRESLRRMTAAISHPAALAEEIATIQAQVCRLESLRDVLTLSKDELEAATQVYQRAFAPRLEAFMADSLSQATQGRYAKVGIDPPTLAVTLVAPERNEPVEAARFSTGTRDLIYLLLRIGVARLMSRTGETLPLLLDDPLVQFDRSRQESTLELLVSLAEETQIVLFTKDDYIMKWFRDEMAGDERHCLERLE